MNACVSSILLGDQDMNRSRRFYTEGLSWKVDQDYGVSVFFRWPPRPGRRVGTSPDGSGFSGLVLTYAVRSEARVDEIIAEAD